MIRRRGFLGLFALPAAVALPKIIELTPLAPIVKPVVTDEMGKFWVGLIGKDGMEIKSMGRQPIFLACEFYERMTPEYVSVRSVDWPRITDNKIIDIVSEFTLSRTETGRFLHRGRVTPNCQLSKDVTFRLVSVTISDVYLGEWGDVRAV